MSSQKVSVLTVSYNAVANGQIDFELLDSLLSSPAGEGIELIVVDNASQDSTVEVLKEVAKRAKQLTVVSLESKIAFEEALLLAVNHSSAPYLWFLDFDALGHLQEVELYLKNLKQFDCIRGVRRRDKITCRLVLSKIFNYLFFVISGVSLRDLGSNFYFMKRDVLPYLLEQRAANKRIFLPLILLSSPFSIGEVEIEDRTNGRSSYPISSLFLRAYSILRGGLCYRIR